MKQFLSLLFCLIICVVAFAQDNDDQKKHDHKHDIDNHKNHIGIAAGPVRIIKEKEWAPGLHLHYARLFEVKEIHFGIGAGLEAIFDDHRHYATSLNLSYYPIHQLTFTVAPGAQFGPNKTEFTSHFEVSYEFIFGKIHLGPVLEYAYAKDDAHAMLGLHLGFGF